MSKDKKNEPLKIPTVKEYMEICINNDAEGMAKFTRDCFGHGETFNNEAASEFSKVVLPLIQERIIKMKDDAPMATPEMMAKVEETRKDKAKVEEVVAAVEVASAVEPTVES